MAPCVPATAAAGSAASAAASIVPRMLQPPAGGRQPAPARLPGLLVRERTTRDGAPARVQNRPPAAVPNDEVRLVIRADRQRNCPRPTLCGTRRPPRH